jgi:hypothetical protein
MKIFIAYPYCFNENGYREAFANEFRDSEIALLYADERLENDHVLAKIRGMMEEADTCLFDISGNNPNVMLELGIAIGDGHPGFVAVDEEQVTNIGADVVGWDQLRYKSYSDLARQVHRHLTKGAVPMRVSVAAEDMFADETETDDRSFFDQVIMPGVVGHYDLLVHPASYNGDLIARGAIPSKLREIEASYRIRSNVPDAVPYDIARTAVENFATGASFVYRHPKWGRWEAGRLHRSGLYRMVRAMRDDFGADGVLRQTEQTVGIADLIEQVTLFYLLARNAARRIVSDPSESLFVSFLVGRLLNRKLRLDLPSVDPTVLICSHTGTEQEVGNGGIEVTMAELEENTVTLAARHIEDILWIFGVGAELVVPIQRRLLGATEPKAFPAN